MIFHILSSRAAIFPAHDIAPHSHHSASCALLLMMMMRKNAHKNVENDKSESHKLSFVFYDNVVEAVGDAAI